MKDACSSCYFVCCLALLVGSCSGGDSQDARERNTSTWERKRLHLEENLHIRETENYYFGSIRDIAVAADGRMVVLDVESRHLKVLGPDGTLIDTLGRRGHGPGEFSAPRTASIGPDDSLYVYDTASRRLTVFTPPPSSRVARSLTVNRDSESDGRGYMERVRVLEDGLVARYRPHFARKEGFRPPMPARWRRMSPGGVLSDTLLTERRRSISISFQGQGVGIEPLPYGRATQVAIGPDSRLYHGWTDSLSIRATSLDGSTRVVADLPTEPVRVSENERDSALSRIDKSDIRQQFDEAMPRTKPAFTELIVSDRGHLWLERPTLEDDRRGRWWRLDVSSRTIQEARVAADIDLEVVRGGYVYGKTTTTSGEPVLVRYEIELDF